MSESRAHILEGVGRDERRYQLPSLQGQCVGRGIPGSKCVIREGYVGGIILCTCLLESYYIVHV